MAVLPIHYPKPLLTALDIHAVELWGPPGPPVGPAAGRIQAYVCPLVRNALAFLAAGRADGVDAVLVPHTCDSLQGLATLLGDFEGWATKPVLTYLQPKGGDRPSARAFVVAELRALAGRLEALAGRPLEADRLRAALELHQAIDAATASLLARRPHLELPDAELYALLRRGEYLWPEDQLAALEGLRSSVKLGRRRRGAPLLVTGYVPEPKAFLEALDAAGAYVAADDYAAVGRRVGGYAGLDAAAPDPIATLAGLSFAGPPCPTRTSDVEARMAHLVRLARTSGARGVLVHTVKFCEPELFDLPALKQTAAEMGLPLLHVESELEAGLSGQVATRLEAFGEVVAARMGAA
jgi:benzoyl-CoA reductase/2-hydroxyglutaryl-CoA dehydratase subunit BcrC/BadD/HgdB